MSQSQPKPDTHVTLRFNRQLTAAEIEELKAKTDAVEVRQAADGHHDHDHPTIEAELSNQTRVQ